MMVTEIQLQDKLIHSMTTTSDPDNILPTTYREAMSSSQKNELLTAIDEELKSMGEEGVFEVVDLKHALSVVPHDSILSSKWVFVKKPERYKARLVARGFKQIHGINYEETRLHLKEVLREIGFTPNNEDPSTYTLIQGVERAILWIHVNDGALTASSPQLMNEIIEGLNCKLKIKWDQNISGLVGISIEKVTEGYKFSQTDLINKLTQLTPSNITSKSPLPIDCKLESNPAAIMDKPYMQRIGILLYIAQASQPDIAYAVNYLARFSMNTTASHWHTLEHLIGYMRDTSTLGILIAEDNSSCAINCYVDANWGGEGDRSTHGYIILHGKNPISWQSKRQSTVASSTAQAEYMALSFAAKECIWITNLFQPVLGNVIPAMLSDNKTAVGISNSSMNRKQTRHLIQEFNLINEYITCGKIHLSWISTANQLADILTKPIGYIKIKQFCKAINWY
ncbi:hypothetical protein O181_075523 [Austropuccinia psidii MF-1]|uniref:Reverse transcriptase Ty1/copia-type domain-containing protein n=1 Tax=Austropuccinia psidii MF-1 TaxID=1389203 RepID=A0A9Q3IBZ2_9BASI|nr:hypothetical protein [Austropuccinia psidii MF-1]